MTGSLARIAVGVGAFAVDRAGVRWCEARSAPRVRGASVVKPLLFWAGAPAGERAGWEALARPAVTVSDNDATAELWSLVGGERLLATVRDRTGVAWRTGAGGEHPALRVLVTAGELARAYAAFAADGGPAAVRLRDWMRAVPPAQAFGAREVACDVLGVAAATVAVKCGWFGVERAHAVALVEQPGRTVGAAVTTYRPPDAASRAACAAAEASAERLIEAHDRFAGPALRAGIRLGLQAAVDL
ncbi:MAG TPA: serine hydrolase [Acidimicrobiales bacterium]|nr:serine hydrolase [Acidimicrobiales bacterium]